MPHEEVRSTILIFAIISAIMLLVLNRFCIYRSGTGSTLVYIITGIVVAISLLLKDCFIKLSILFPWKKLNRKNAI